MTAALAFLRAHWRALCVALGLALAFGAGRWSRRQPPVPTVALKQDTAVQRQAAEDLTQRKAQGAETITTTEEDYGPPAAGDAAQLGPGGAAGQSAAAGPASSRAPTVPPAPVLVKRIVTVDQRGPVVTDTHETARSSETDRTHIELKLTPPPRGPRFAVAVGLDDPLGAQRPHFEVGARVLTVPLLDVPLWLRLGSTPSRGVIHGTTISGEIQW